MRSADLLPSPVQRLLTAVRRWGNTTHDSYDDQVRELLALRDLCAKFTRPCDWLYRGAGMKSAAKRRLLSGDQVVVDPRSMLSWTEEFGVAAEFAEGTLEAEMLLIEKQGMTPFFCFSVFAEYLDSMGYDYSDDLALTDPIREKEVIVFTDGPLTITVDDCSDHYL
jgi:hypothetical protein